MAELAPETKKVEPSTYPLVFVVDEDSEEDRFVWALQHDCSISEERKKEIANANGIFVLDGMEVLVHLREEVDPDSVFFLRSQVQRGCASSSPIPFTIPPTGRVLKFVEKKFYKT